MRFFPVSIAIAFLLFLGREKIMQQIPVQPARDFEVVILDPSSSVGQFQKVEMGMTLPADVEKEVEAFVHGDASGINPFDPAQISVEAVFTHGNRNDTVYGFYFRDFSRDENAMQPFKKAQWLEKETNYHWRIRFAPPETGTWRCVVSIRLKNENKPSYRTDGLELTCVSSSEKGFLEKGNDNWHLAYSGSKESFFALGQVIPWNDADDIGYGVPYFRGGKVVFKENPGFDKLDHGGFLDVLGWIEDLADHGGNMVRTAIVPWGCDFEFEQPGNYSNRLDRAWELDQLVQTCERKNMKLSIDLQFFATGSDNPNPQFNWSSNPYSKIPGVNSPDDFLTNDSAKTVFRNKLRYFMARWGYSSSLAILTLTGEIDGWKYKDGALKNNPVAQQEQLDWYREMIGFTKRQAAYRPLLMTTSYGGTSGRDYRKTPFDLAEMDLTTLHLYNTERSANIDRRFGELNNRFSSKGTHTLWPDKPTYFQEIGVADYGADPGDMEGCSDVSMHNMLWSTAFMGGFGTGFPWWQHFNAAHREANYPALATFFSGVDFQNNRFTVPGAWDNSSAFNADHSSSTIEVFYLTAAPGDQCMGWVHNTSWWWGNTDRDCRDRNNKAMRLPSDDDAPAAPQPLPPGTKFEIHGISNLDDYAVTWYATRGNGGVIKTQTAHANIFGTLKLRWAGNENDADLAFKIKRQTGVAANTKISSDTLLAGQDTIHAHGNYFFPGKRAMNYHWDFGNGQQSDKCDAVAVYNRPGTYLVTLEIADEKGNTITLRQYIVKSADESML